METFTTGQVSGLTNLPPTTVHKYTNRYREYFSTESTKPKRGRRYTGEDVNRLLLIRRMIRARAEQAEIESALASGEQVAAVDAVQILEQAQSLLEQTTTTARRAENAATTAEVKARTLDRLIKQFAESVTLLDERVARIEQAAKGINARTTPQKEDRIRKFFDRIRDFLDAG